MQAVAHDHQSWFLTDQVLPDHFLERRQGNRPGPTLGRG